MLGIAFKYGIVKLHPEECEEKLEEERRQQKLTNDDIAAR